MFYYTVQKIYSNKNKFCRYDKKTGEIKKVYYPFEKILVFDVETLVLDNNRPVIAAAMSSDAWFEYLE